jgi:photosystem II stability/assembly factor-like uncharacterized protein
MCGTSKRLYTLRGMERSVLTLNGKHFGTIALAAVALLLITSLIPAQGATSYGRWRDISPTQYLSSDPTATLRGLYVRNGGSGAIGAGDGWAVGGDTAIPLIAHYDGFSWEIRASPAAVVYNSVHFCTSPGAPGVGLCSPNGDGSDGWVVGGPNGAPPGAAALYWDGAALTPVTTGLTASVILNSVFMACHSPQWGTGCPGSLAAGLTFAVGTDGGAGVIYQFNGNPKSGGGWTLQFTSALATTYNSVYMYIDQAGNLAGFAAGDAGVVARLNGGTWTESVIAAGVTFYGVFVDQGNPADAWAVGSSGNVWHFTSGIWTGGVSPAASGNDLLSIFLTSTSEGWVVGAHGTILHSTSLGSSNVWLALTQPLQTAVGTGINLLGVSFPSGGNGWAVGTQGIILHTENSNCGSAVPSPCWGGSTSITEVTPGQQLNSVFMVGTNDAWAAGSWDTTSGIPSLIHWDGNKWHRASIAPHNTPTPDVFGIYMLGSGEGWAVGGGPAGGDTIPEAMKWDGNIWTGQPIAASGTSIPKSVYMISGGTGGDGWAVGTAGVIWRYQSGSWGTIASPTANNLNAVVISNAGSNTNAGWAVGDAGTALKLSITGGVPTWNVVGVPGITTQNLYSVYFKDSNHGWIVGDGATIVSTTDGGNSWSGGPGQVIGTPAGTVLRSVFIDTYGTGSGNGDGWAVGYDGAGNSVFAHWDGASWTSIPVAPALAPGLGLYSVYLTSPTDGFAVGAGISGTTSLSGIFHLDPPDAPTQIVTTIQYTTVTTTSTSSSSASSSSTSTISSTTSSASTSSTGTTSTQVSTSSSATSQSTSSSATATSISTVTVTASSSSSSSSATTPLIVPAVPGFPWESIAAGIILGLSVLFILRRRRPTTA